MNLLSGFHKHHIVPRYRGGSDAPENLVLLHPIDHAIAHFVRYKIYGNVRDLWASNWLQKIVDPDVYSQFSKEREEEIKKRRAVDPEFDAHMKKVRSEATKSREEGYQKEAGSRFKEKMLQQSEYSDRIRSNRRASNAASLKVRRGASEEKAKQVIAMRNSGCKYSEIQKETGYSLGAISLIVNKKMMASVTETGSAQVS
jgi:hypothetical protein